MSLLDNKLAPLTFSLGFLEMSFQTVVDAYVGWRKELNSSVVISPIELPLKQALLKLEPLEGERQRPFNFGMVN
jgi:hypothetical protein